MRQDIRLILWYPLYFILDIELYHKSMDIQGMIATTWAVEKKGTKYNEKEIGGEMLSFCSCSDKTRTGSPSFGLMNRTSKCVFLLHHTTKPHYPSKDRKHALLFLCRSRCSKEKLLGFSSVLYEKFPPVWFFVRGRLLLFFLRFVLFGSAYKVNTANVCLWFCVSVKCAIHAVAASYLHNLMDGIKDVTMPHY